MLDPLWSIAFIIGATTVCLVPSQDSKLLMAFFATCCTFLVTMNKHQTQRGVGGLAPAAGKLDYLASAEALSQKLEAAGIDTSKFGSEVSKTLPALLNELLLGESSLECGCISGRITRRVEPVFTIITFRGRVLVEKCQVLPDGRQRSRQMLLAEKKRPEDHSPVEASLRALRTELHVGTIGARAPPFGLLHLKESDACVLEDIDSASYPGLPCVYRNHLVNFEISEDAEAIRSFSACGLPRCEAFETVESTSDGPLKHEWMWMSIADARERKVKGLHLQF